MLSYLPAAVQNRLHLAVGQARVRTDHALRDAEFSAVCRMVKFHDAGERQAVFARTEGADVVGEFLRQHGQNRFREIDAGAAAVRLLIQRAARPDVRGDVRDMHAQNPAVFRRLDGDGVVEILAVIPVDGERHPVPKILSARAIARGDGFRNRLRILFHGGRERGFQTVRADETGDLRIPIELPSDHFDDFSLGISLRVARNLALHFIARLRGFCRRARDKDVVKIAAVVRYHEPARLCGMERADQFPVAALFDLNHARQRAVTAAAADFLRQYEIPVHGAVQVFMRDKIILSAAGGDQKREPALVSLQFSFDCFFLFLPHIQYKKTVVSVPKPLRRFC